MFFGRHRSVYKVCRYFFFSSVCWWKSFLMQRNGDNWNKRNISDTAVFSGKKGCFYGNQTIFACKFYLLYICRYIEPSSQIENTKACIAEKVLRSMGGFFIGLVTRESRRRGSLSIHLLSYLLFHPLKLLVLFLFFIFNFSSFNIPCLILIWKLNCVKWLKSSHF